MKRQTILTGMLFVAGLVVFAVLLALRTELLATGMRALVGMVAFGVLGVLLRQVHKLRL